jgi:hypothetical protein
MFSKAQASGFANYLLANKYVFSAAEAATLVLGLRVLSSNKYHEPVVVGAELKRITSSQRSLAINAGNAIGEQLSLEVEGSFELDGSKKATLTFSAVSGQVYVNILCCLEFLIRLQRSVFRGPCITVSQARRQQG